MKIYLDLYFLINYILDLTILIGVSKLLKIKVKIIRLLLGSLVGSISLILLFIKVNNITLFIIKVIISILMIIITFGINNILINTMYFYILSIIIGGTLYLLDIDTSSLYLNYLLLIILSPIILYIFIKDNIKLRKTNMIKHLVKIKYKNNNIELYGIIDTGNSLIDPISKKHVLLIDKYIDIDKPIFIPFKALNNTGIIKCLKPDKLYIDDKEYNNILVGISNNKLNLLGSSCILPNSLVEEI